MTLNDAIVVIQSVAQHPADQLSAQIADVDVLTAGSAGARRKTSTMHGFLGATFNCTPSIVMILCR